MSGRPPRHAQIALPNALRKTFTYSVPRELEEVLQAGHRVRVPFGRQTASGYVVGFTTETPSFALKPIQALDPPEVLFTPEILKLTSWVADYYLAPWGQVLEAALPPSVRRGAPGRPGRAADPAAAGVTEEERPAGVGLEPEQIRAVEAISAAVDARRYAGFLLLGVTGSGKTEVYLEAAERVVRNGGGVLFLVPEIAMGTQILARVKVRFGAQAGFFHSQTGSAERRRVWREAREGRLPVVVGTRSAAFVPMPDLRLVIVDEEHEAAYKQEETPRYHGRDVVIVRARNAGAVVVLGSATPALESLHNVERGKYEMLRLTRRIDGRPPARVTVVDLRVADPAEQAGASDAGAEGRRRARGPSGGGRARGGPHTVLSPVLLRAVQERLDRGEQSILFLNRRGHSPVVQCSDCGKSIQCRHCDVVMTLHKADNSLRCHYCGAIVRDLKSCPDCAGKRFFYGGVGTQKVEELLREAFPEARLARMDFDATRRRGTHGRLVAGMEAGEIDILLGTQMVAKGFHFPRVTLVGVIQADREMLQPDFRATERAFQILTQVAGRAGRGDLAGEVVFQALMPWHHVIACAADEDYAGFAEEEMASRRALEYPPYHRLIDLLVDGAKEEQVVRRSEAVREAVEVFLGASARSRKQAVEVLGPAPMPHARLKGRYRWHLTLKGPSVETLHRAALAALEAEVPKGLSGTRIQVDVDPLGMA